LLVCEHRSDWQSTLVESESGLLKSGPQ